MRYLKPGLLLFGGLAIASFFLITYDKFWGLDDGLIAGVAFKKVLTVLTVFCVVLGILVWALSSGRRAVQNVALFCFSLFFCLVIVEVFAFFSIRSGLIDAEKPRHHLFTDASDLISDQRPFWGDYNPHFAKWHLPLDTLKRVNCAGDSLFSYINSFGARDKERQKQSLANRVVLLGDSFIEGFMVNADQRMSNLLESTTGVEHLNFGINGTSPINYYLTYKHLARDFDHDVVLIGILPGNDFEDFTAAKRASLIESPIYRPYWEGIYPDYRLRYSLASHTQSVHSLAMFNSPEKLPGVIDSVFCQLSVSEKFEAATGDNAYSRQMIQAIGRQIAGEAPAGFSRYNTYSEEEWNIFSYSLEQLLEEAADKKIILLVFPILQDLLAYDVTKQNRLAGALDSLVSDRTNVDIIDFLPITYQEKKGEWEDLYVLCDGHWSVEGEKFASEVVLNHPVYRAALADTTGRADF